MSLPRVSSAPDIRSYGIISDDCDYFSETERRYGGNESDGSIDNDNDFYGEPDENTKLLQTRDPRSPRNVYMGHVQCQQFFRYLLEKNWKGIEEFISKNPGALTAKIKVFKQETFLHILTRNLDVPDWLMQNLTSRVTRASLERLKDESGRSPLFWAAMYGNKKAAEAFVKKNENLLYKEDRNHLLAVHVAAYCGHKDVVKYLLKETIISLNGEKDVAMLKDLIQSGLYGIAIGLLKGYPRITCSQEVRGSILTLLAQNPRAFKSGRRLTYWKRFIYHWLPVEEEQISLPHHRLARVDIENPRAARSILRRQLSQTAPYGTGLHQKLYIKFWDAIMLLVPSLKSIQEKKLAHMQTLEIVRIMCHEGVTWSHKEALQSLSRPILLAARYGICELVEQILKAYFYSFTFIEESTEHGIFHLSILHRKKKVFNLLNKMNLSLWHWKAANTSEHNENILHLAGELVPSTKVSGAALQMQRELQWFMAVASYVHPSLQEQRNRDGKTPRQVFTKNHESLVKEGEKWMKRNAKSCSIVAALIITVVFAAAFTVPGDDNSSGIPNFLHKPSFIIFATSDALALFSSSASLLMFLGILTSRYSEEDFLESLPKKLMIGLLTMFFSIASMMVAFGAVIYILLSDLWSPVFIPIAVLGGIIVLLFASLQSSLLVEVYLSTYWSSIYLPTK